MQSQGTKGSKSICNIDPQEELKLRSCYVGKKNNK